MSPTPDLAEDERAGRALERIGPWRVERVLGRGGAGTVFEGCDDHGSRVAIKVPDEGGARAAWLLHEARFAARLRHPHIVQLEGRGTLGDGRPYLVYELVEGRALDTCADALAARDVVRIGAELLDALTYAHDAGVLHLDLSPANVMLDAESRTKLTDFGLAMSHDRRARAASRSALVAGTPGYLSPEQALGSGGVGPRADLYGVGALLYRLIAGFPPHFGADGTEIIQRTLHGEPLPLAPRPGLLIGDAACTLVERMLARDPEARPPSAARAREAWLHATDALFVLRDGPPSTPTPAVPLRRPATFLATEIKAPDGPAPTGDVRATRTSRRRPRAESGADHRIVPERIGRDEVLDALDQSVVEPVWVVGPPGVGVSRVLDAHVERLHRADAVVARTTGRRGIASPPLEIFAGLLLDLTDGRGLPPWASAERVIGALDAASPRGALEAAKMAISSVLLGAARPVTSGAAMECFRAMLALRPPGRPMALVVDDADRIDAASEALLRQLALSGVRVVLGGHEPREGSLAVEALDRRQAAQLAEAVGAPDPERAASALDRLPAAIVAYGAFDDARPRAAALESLGHEERTLLEAAVVFEGIAIPLRALPDVAASAVGVRELPALDDWIVPVSASAARLEPWATLADPALPAHLTPTPTARERAIRWLARECRDQSYGLQAWTAELAASAGQNARAAHAAAEAGRRAASCDAPEAASLLELALAHARAEPEAIDRPGVLAALATIEAARAPERAFERAEQVLTEAHPERRVLRSRMRRLQAQVRTDERASAEALRLLDEAIDLLGEYPDPEELAEQLSSKGWVLGYLMGDNDAGIELGRRALAIAGQVDTPSFQARLCGKLGANQLRAGDWDGQLATNLRDLGLSGIAHDVHGQMRAHINLGVCHTNRGLLGLARAHTEEAARLAEAHGTLRAGQIAWNNLAMIAADEGRWRDALAAAERSRELCPSDASEIAETWEAIFRARLHLGGDARSALERVRELATGAERSLGVRAAVRTMAPPEAVAALDELLEAHIGDPYDRARNQLALAAAVRACGDTERARELERSADAVLEALGADPALERRRGPHWDD